MVTVYIIESIQNGTRYVGITNNLGRRLRDHRSGKTKGGQLLGTFELLYKEEYSDYPTAREREKYLKTGAGRRWLERTFPRTRPAKGG